MSGLRPRALLSPQGMAQSALPSKLFFRIGEVAGLVGVEPHVLRYWEREFRAIRPTKSSKGQRVYSRKDVENLMRVRALLYEEGFTIAGAKKRLGRPVELGAPEPDADTLEDASTDAKAPHDASARVPEPLAETPSLVRETSTSEVTSSTLQRVADAVHGARQAERGNEQARASLLDLRVELERLLSSLDDE